MTARSRLHLDALALLCLLSMFMAAASAEDATSLAIGAPIADGTLKLGARTWTLPPGAWRLGGRHLRDVKLTDTRTGAEVIEVYSALVREGAVRAGLFMTGTTGGSQVHNWREDPACKPGKPLLFEDSSTATLSDCLVIRVLEGQPTQVPGVEVYASAAKWLQAESLKTPRPVFNVVIVKYQGSEYFRTAAWLDPADFGVKGEEAIALRAAPESLVQWARAYRAVIAKAVGSMSGVFVVPPLPGPR
jgi:hypothetical protein